MTWQVQYIDRRRKADKSRMRQYGKISSKCTTCRKTFKKPATSFRPSRCLDCELMAVELQSKAGGLVATAVRHGVLAKAVTLQCVDCGKPASEYDHRDYHKPLDVVPVCRSCNYMRGPAIQLKAL